MYVSTKFDSVVTEIANISSLDGTALTFGSVDEGGHHALVNLGGVDEIRGFDLEMDVRLGLTHAYREFCDEHHYSYDMDLFVIIREDDRGFVTCEMHTDLETEAYIRWEEMEAEYLEDYADDEDI